MSAFQHISIQDAAEKLDTFAVVDIRDPQSFANGHMPDALNLNNDNFAEFLDETDKDTPVLVVCYHGVSSQQAANVIANQGYNRVFSMDGGFEAWKLNYTVVTDQA
ncbi:thiosulfate sulfurtransferase GlpE [Aestuariibacter sp. A3R04]|uniref:thiosulfate sulfurtransferase GlpE n=1 Tax=Aestuariibacter sp. A3R04 TaxID=2841571 RepID=UPI001C087513|nr:thiosulfate sulfurtransferase GlpE [Aestuariibacter sp. A3R04]MBU3023845.1 thiosulfate sulfurtransferase GlpE [Aestuariibacter sp. A3R04]